MVGVNCWARGSGCLQPLGQGVWAQAAQLEGFRVEARGARETLVVVCILSPAMNVPAVRTEISEQTR